jgi:hypothetical protein
MHKRYLIYVQVRLNEAKIKKSYISKEPVHRVKFLGVGDSSTNEFNIVK